MSTVHEDNQNEYPEEEVERKPDISLLLLDDPEVPQPEEPTPEDQTTLLKRIYEKLTAGEAHNRLIEQRIQTLEKNRKVDRADAKDFKNQMRILGEVQKLNIATLESLKGNVAELGEFQKAEFKEFKEILENSSSEVTMEDVEELEEQACLFCNESDHKSADCRTISNWMDRKSVLCAKKICEKCLKADDENHTCPRGSEDCPNCAHRFVGDKTGLTRHHPIVCFFKSNQPPKETRPSRMPR